jgi:excisionase family DNA binding protein
MTPGIEWAVSLVARLDQPIHFQVVTRQQYTIGAAVLGDDSTCQHGLAGFPLSFAAPLQTVREVAAFLRVSTRTVYAMCAQGRLAHVRVMNAIRIAPGTLLALDPSLAK